MKKILDLLSKTTVYVFFAFLILVVPYLLVGEFLKDGYPLWGILSSGVGMLAFAVLFGRGLTIMSDE